MQLRPLLTLALFCGLPSAAFAAGESRFGAWDVSCSSRTYCVAAATARTAEGEVAVFKLERGPAPDSKVFVTTGPSEPLGIGMRVDVDINGLSEPYGVYGDVKRIYDGNEMTFAGAARRKFVEMLRSGETADISVAFGGAVGTLSYRVPLEGLTLALLEIDRRQGRMDRKDAIVAWGGLDLPPELAEAPATAVATPEPAPAAAAAAAVGVAAYDLVYSSQELPGTVAATGNSDLGCALDDATQMFGAQVIEFTTGGALYLVPCHPADANVESYVVWQPDGGNRYEVVEFARDDSEEISTLMTNPEYDDQARRITSHGYYSPEYDCGYFSAWSFDPVSGGVHLVEERVKDQCDGAVVPPADWPRVR